jgi:hypothetical protein
VLSGILYSIYLLISKKVLAHPFFYDVEFASFNNLLRCCMFSATATIFRLFKYGLVCIIYSSGSLPVDGLVIGKFCNQHMRATRVSLSLLSQAVITSILAWLFWMKNYN